uniref:winged helix-turn-helix transcriptional regulator n=1 Tax=uncultured Altererythrobacter sp. TaxID=500840 RepID=UPI002616C376|nr:helix-turn-helix domain-containing protein [uncultured Altererythrobacter sp.]
MMRNSDACRSNCPINFVLETFGDRWTLLIVRDLMFKGKQTFGAFLESEEKISTNILTDRLRRLEAHEIIEKTVAEDNRSKLIYSLTEKGKDLIPVMLEVTAWSVKHDTKSNAPDTFLKDYENARDQVIAMVRTNLD